MNYTLKNALIKTQDVSLSFGNRVILKPTTVEVRDIVRSETTPTGQIIGLLGPSGIGKCLAKGTLVLMFDGTTKKVEHIRVGDCLMGPDSKPRRVLNLGQGIDVLYRIQPKKGDSFVVNAPHILALHLGRSKRGKEKYLEVPVSEYLTRSPTFKARTRLYRVGVDFPSREVPIDAYLFGLWLGDGDTGYPAITNQDAEVVEAVQEFAQASGAEVTRYAYSGKCPRYRLHNHWKLKNQATSVFNRLRETGAIQDKHIPLAYKANSREVRLKLLAGIIDSDGGVIGDNCYEVVSKIKELAQDYCYLARSLGLAAYCQGTFKRAQTGEGSIYHRVIISGHVSEIPVRIPRKTLRPRRQIKNVLRTGFTVQAEGVGQYYGFELDGDGLFLLGDFTVTHNTQFSRMLTGLQEPTSGSIQVVDYANDPTGEKMVPVRPGVVGLVAQNYPLFKHRTVKGNLLVALEKSKLSPKDRLVKAREYLALFELSDKEDRFPVQLSGGQRQRIAIIQALLCSEHFLVLDEPFTGLDPLMRDLTCDLILKVANIDERNTIFVVAHDISALVKISDHLWMFGRDRDEAGQTVPGATIKYAYDLIERGLAWRPGIDSTQEFHNTVTEVKAQFKNL
jgi:ABC-type nitrate/sulfonate/bicarbonate transport system ATPase subunit